MFHCYRDNHQFQLQALGNVESGWIAFVTMAKKEQISEDHPFIGAPIRIDAGGSIADNRKFPCFHGCPVGRESNTNKLENNWAWEHRYIE